MPTFKKNPNPTMKTGPYKMKYKHSAFPFKSSPAKRAMGDFMPQVPGDTGAIVPPHTHDDGGGTGVVHTQGQATAGQSRDTSGQLQNIMNAAWWRGGRRTGEGQV